MKIKLDIKTKFELPEATLEQKVSEYLKNNFYRITDRGPGYIIFIDDEFSDRKTYRSDYHTRIGEGKFEFHSSGEFTVIRLIYLTQVLYPMFLIMVFAAFGIYTKSIVPIIFSFAFILPILYKMYYLKEHVFKEIAEV